MLVGNIKVYDIYNVILFSKVYFSNIGAHHFFISAVTKLSTQS
jgi:hypothetical protein